MIYVGMRAAKYGMQGEMPFELDAEAEDFIQRANNVAMKALNTNPKSKEKSNLTRSLDLLLHRDIK